MLMVKSVIRCSLLSFLVFSPGVFVFLLSQVCIVPYTHKCSFLLLPPAPQRSCLLLLRGPASCSSEVLPPAPQRSTQSHRMHTFTQVHKQTTNETDKCTTWYYLKKYKSSPTAKSMRAGSCCGRGLVYTKSYVESPARPWQSSLETAVVV